VSDKCNICGGSTRPYCRKCEGSEARARIAELEAQLAERDRKPDGQPDMRLYGPGGRVGDPSDLAERDRPVEGLRLTVEEVKGQIEAIEHFSAGDAHYAVEQDDRLAALQDLLTLHRMAEELRDRVEDQHVLKIPSPAYDLVTDARERVERLERVIEAYKRLREEADQCVEALGQIAGDSHTVYLDDYETAAEAIDAAQRQIGGVVNSPFTPEEQAEEYCRWLEGLPPLPDADDLMSSVLWEGTAEDGPDDIDIGVDGGNQE
jgi:hypothetical protein